MHILLLTNTNITFTTYVGCTASVQICTEGGREKGCSPQPRTEGGRQKGCPLQPRTEGGREKGCPPQPLTNRLQSFSCPTRVCHTIMKGYLLGVTQARPGVSSLH